MNKYEREQIQEKAESVLQKFFASGRTAPFHVAQIPGFPFSSYEKIIEEVRNGKAAIEKFTFRYEANVMRIFATHTELALSKALVFSYCASPFAALILGITISWWFLTLLFITPIAMSINKNLYLEVLNRSPLISEACFCLLFITRDISLTDKIHGKRWYFMNNSAQFENTMLQP